MCKLIKTDLDCFYNGLSNSRSILDTFSGNLENRLENIDYQLKKMGTIIKNLEIQGDTPAAKLLNGEIGNWSKSIEFCQKQASANFKGRNFQNKFEKAPLLIVFGVVKAGKSTLGNFIHGRAFRNASFSNIYQTVIPNSKIYVEESGRDGDSHVKEAFDENSIESTCSAQYFEIPGLVWVDTPGIGAIEKSIDIRPLEEIAKEFVQFADLVVFLANSANPGINEDISNYCSLYKAGKKALLVITRSDTVKNSFTNGKLIKELVAKDAQRRKDQENSILAAMKENGIPEKDITSISISTRLAEKAVDLSDDSLWVASNMGLFYKNIIDIIGDEKVLKLKQQTPKLMLNQSIEKIIGTEDSAGSMANLIKAMQITYNTLKERFDSLSPDSALVSTIVEDSVNSVRSVIRRSIEELGTDASDGTNISISSMQAQIQDNVNTILTTQITNLIGEYQHKLDHNFNACSIQTQIYHKKERQSYTVKEAYSVEREADGIVENIKSLLFNTRYHEVKYRNKQKHIDIDLGADTTTAKQEILRQLEQGITQFVKQELANLRADFFQAAMEKLSLLIRDLENLKDNLIRMQYNHEQ